MGTAWTPTEMDNRARAGNFGNAAEKIVNPNKKEARR